VPVPLILKVATVAQGLPALGGLRYGARLTPGRRWIVASALWALAVNLLGWYLAWRGIRNLWVIYFTGPIEVAVLLMALSSWHPAGTIRRLFFHASWLFLALDVIMLVSAVERIQDFSLVVTPIKALLILGAALTTLLALIARVPSPLVEADWFWVCIGLCVRYGVTAAIDPYSRIFLHNDPGKVYSAYVAKAWIEVFATLLILRGVLCPLPRPAFSGSTSPVSAPSSSS